MTLFVAGTLQKVFGGGFVFLVDIEESAGALGPENDPRSDIGIGLDFVIDPRSFEELLDGEGLF